MSFEAINGAVYTYCRYCEKSSWVSEGKRLQTRHVLAEASKIEPARARR